MMFGAFGVMDAAQGIWVMDACVLKYQCCGISFTRYVKIELLNFNVLE